MARLIVLKFENDEDADDFVDKVNKTSKVDFDFYQCPTVEGAFQTPTKFCDCSFRGDGWRKSEKHGWWLHYGCGRPSVGWSSNVRAVIRSANDLLERKSSNTQERIDSVTGFYPETGEPREGYE